MVALRHLVSSLRNEFEVIGLLFWILGKRFDRSTTVESIAEEVLAEIRLRQPHGPDFIAGYSLGGLVAYEVAEKASCGRGNRPLVGVDRHLGTRDDEATPSPVVTGAAPWPPPSAGSWSGCGVRLYRQLVSIRPFPLLSDHFHRGQGRPLFGPRAATGDDAPLDVFIAEGTAAAYGPSLQDGTGCTRARSSFTRSPGNHDLGLDVLQAKVIA